MGQQLLLSSVGIMELLRFIYEVLLGELVIVIVGVLFANFIKSRWDTWRYGGWRVLVKDVDGTALVSREVSPRKAQEVLDEPADLAVFLKGVASSYATLNCDLIGEGLQNGLLTVDREGKCFVIDLQHNPPDRRKEEARL